MPHCLFSAAFTKSDIEGKVRWVRLKFDFGLLVCLSAVLLYLAAANAGPGPALRLQLLAGAVSVGT